MFRDILVPLDGSRFAEAALPVAARLARLGHARLYLLLTREPTIALVGVGEPSLPSVIEPGQEEQDRAYLAKTAAAFRPPGGVPVGFRLVEGLAGPETCEEATRLDADLLVLATREQGKLRRLWLPSDADYVVRHATAPVLLAPQDGPALPTCDGRCGGILVALDLSKEAEAILEPVIALAQLTEAHVTLMHVVERVVEAATEAQQHLDRVADRLRGRGLSVCSRVVTGLDAAGTLLDALDEDRYAFLALTTHGRGRLGRLLLGRVADKVIRGVSKPVLVFRPPPAIVTAG